MAARAFGACWTDEMLISTVVLSPWISPGKLRTSAENVKSRWVNYEWDSFFPDILDNVKPDGQIFTCLNGVSPKELPISLRHVQSFAQSCARQGRRTGQTKGY